MGDSRGGLAAWVSLSSGCDTGNLHFLSFFSGTQDESCPIKQPIHDVGLLPNAVVAHLAFTVGPKNQQHWRFAVLHLARHLDIGLRAIVKDPHRAKVFVPSRHFVVEIHFLDGDHRRRGVGATFRLVLALALLS